MRARTLLEGVGASLLLLFSHYLPFFHPRNHDLFHHGLPVTHLVGGLLIDLLGVALLVSAALMAVDHLPANVRKYLLALFAALMIWKSIAVSFTLLFRLRLGVGRYEHFWDHWVVYLLVLGCVTAYLWPRFTDRAVRATRILVAAFAFSGLWIVPWLVVIAASRPYVSPALAEGNLPPASYSPGPRVIWVLFDELSYDQTFEHRAPGIDLPNFDRLRSMSVSFSHVRPIGYYTDRIIPSLFMDKTFTEFRSTISGELYFGENGKWVRFDPNTTLFAVAKKNGWNPGVDGWYNPMCNILAPVVITCSWSPDVLPGEEYGASEDRSALTNSTAVVREAADFATGREITPADTHVRDYREIMARAKALIGNDRLHFLYLHLPIPHPPGIYDRGRHELQSHGNYLDNLVLSDDALSELMSEIKASPAADRTILIVTSDHSWRTAIYRDRADWTAEEERASGGKFDDRPVLLVHFPDQFKSEDYSAPISEMVEYDFIVGMLDRQIQSEHDLESLAVKAPAGLQARR